MIRSEMHMLATASARPKWLACWRRPELANGCIKCAGRPEVEVAAIVEMPRMAAVVARRRRSASCGGVPLLQ